MTYVLWAKEKNETFFETFMTETDDRNYIDFVIEKAKEKGFHSFRISQFNMAIAPDFVNTINKP